jgi:hypothetical protein
MDFINNEKLKIPIYSPRTSYKKIKESDDNLLQELMLKLDPFTVSVIGNDFKCAGGEIKVEEFIVLLKHHLKEWKTGKDHITNRDYKIRRILVNLFD